MFHVEQMQEIREGQGEKGFRSIFITDNRVSAGGGRKESLQKSTTGGISTRSARLNEKVVS